MRELIAEIKNAARILLRAPGYATVILLLFAFGIATTTVLFGLLKSVVLDPLPYPRAGELVTIRESLLPEFPEFAVATGKFALWQAQSRSFEGLALSREQGWNLTGLAQPERVEGARVSPSFFRVLGAPMSLGTDFGTPSQEAAETEQLAVLGHAAWQRLFGGDPAVLGRIVQLDGRSVRIVGIAPKASWVQADIFTPWRLDATEEAQFGSHSVEVLGRLHPGVTVTEALADLNGIAAEIEQEHAVSAGWRVTMKSLPDAELAELREVLWLLFGAALVVLLIAVLNIACLGLLRATRRQRELDARIALGASAGRIALHLGAESLLLATAGGLLGVLLGVAAFGLLRQSDWLPLPRIETLGLDPPVLAVSLGASLLAGLLSAWLPARSAARRASSGMLRGTGRGQVGGQGRMRDALVIGEITLAVLLLTGAGLLTRSLWALAQVSPGFAAEDLQYTRIALPESRYADDATIAQFQQQWIDRVETLPGVSGAGLAHAWPFLEDNWLALKIEGQTPADPRQPPTALYYMSSPGVPGATGLPLLRGRWFTDADRAGAAPVAVVNQALARRHFGTMDPIGQRLQTSKSGDARVEIVGVVGDTRQYGLDNDVAPQIYLPMAQHPRREFFLLLDSTLAGDVLRGALVQSMSGLDASVPVPAPHAISERMAQAMFLRHLLFWLVSAFGAVAMALAAVGLYSTIAYAVSQSQRELGLRIALGATASQMLGGVLRQGIRLALAGAVMGLGLGLLAGNGARDWVYGVGAFDPWTFCFVPLLMLAVATLACLSPALRVARMGPMAALQAAD